MCGINQMTHKNDFGLTGLSESSIRMLGLLTLVDQLRNIINVGSKSNTSTE